MLNIAALAATGGVEPQLTGHIKTAVDVTGISPEEAAECFVHLMPYVGVPKTLAAMRCMKAVLESYCCQGRPGRLVALGSRDQLDCFFLR